jgi:hypothetical protein
MECDQTGVTDLALDKSSNMTLMSKDRDISKSNSQIRD